MIKIKTLIPITYNNIDIKRFTASMKSISAAAKYSYENNPELQLEFYFCIDHSDEDIRSNSTYRSVNKKVLGIIQSLFMSNFIHIFTPSKSKGTLNARIALIRRAYNCSIGYTYDDLKEYSYGLFLDSDDLISLEYYSYIYEDILPYDVISFTYHVVDLDGVKSEYSSNEVHILSWMKIGMIHNRLIKMEVLNKMVKDHFTYEVPKICKGEDHLMVILIMTQDIKYINFSCIRNNYRFDNLPTYHYFNRSKNTIQDGSDQERWTFDAYHLIFHRLATNYPHILLALKSCCKKMVGKYLERCRRFGVTPLALLRGR